MMLDRYWRIIAIVFIALLIATANTTLAQEKKTPATKTKRPPLLVTTVEVRQGAIQAMSDFLGTTYFARVSKVATDIEGLVIGVNFDEGDVVKKGDELVLLDSKLLQTEITAARAAAEQNLVDLENAQRDFKRFDTLYKNNSISETQYDSYRLKQVLLEKKSAVLAARLEKLLISKEKKSIKAPFGGIVIQQNIELGEWVAKGGNVTVIADNSKVEINVDLPVEFLQNLKKGREVRIRINGKEYAGKFTVFIPRGDIATRTFTTKFSLKNSEGIIEGLEALVSLPLRAETEGLLVPRDAIVDKYGHTMVFRVIDSKAVEVPVQVVDYIGAQAVVKSPGLLPGHVIVLKGSKRVEDGISLQFR